tara:strand:+ start:2640 stop:3704 length:1065 start_codon:yes stop_codon:yes gene_type:complete
MKISDVNMERKLTGGEKRSKESHFKKLKKHKKDFRKQYGDDAESVMHAVATKRAKGESVENEGKNKMGPQEIAVGDRVEFEGEKFEVVDVELDTIVADNLETGLRNRLHTDKVTPLFGMDAMTDQEKADAEAMFKRLKKAGSGSLKHVATEMLEMTKWLKVNEGYYSLPPIDRKRYDEMPGMDGPIMTRSGKVVYYDPKSGQYYDRDSDMFLTHDEWKALDSVSGQRESRVHDDEMDQAARLKRRIARAKREGDIDAQKKAEEELKAIFAKGLHVNRAQEDINEADDPLAILRRIVDNKQAEKIHGVMVDMFTASALVQVYDKVNDENQVKMKKFLQSAQGLQRMADFALSKLS